MAKKYDTTDAADVERKLASKCSRTLLALPIAALGLLAWQATAMAAAPVAAAAGQTAENAACLLVVGLTSFATSVPCGDTGAKPSE